MSHDKKIKKNANIYRMLREVSDARSLQEIADLAIHILGNPIFIEDRSAYKLAHTRGVKVDDPRWEEGVVETKIIPPDTNQVQEVLDGYERSRESGLPVILHDSFMEGARMVKAIYHDGEHLGTIVSPAYFRDFDEKDIDLMEILAGFVEHFLVKERYPLHNGLHAAESLLYQMLSGAQFSEMVIKDISEYQSWDAETIHFILDIFPRHEVYEGKTFAGDIMEEFRALRGCQCVFYNMHIVCFSHAREPLGDLSEDDIPFTPVLEKYGLIAGVSQPFTDLHQINRYYSQALSMAKLATILDREHLYYQYDKYACYHMMEIVAKDLPLAPFCHHKILALEEYDKKHNTDLIQTLHAYLESSRSISHTAQILFMHKNTVTYRINKCFELMDTRIEDNDELFSFLFSLRLMEYGRKRQENKV